MKRISKSIMGALSLIMLFNIIACDSEESSSSSTPTTSTQNPTEVELIETSHYLTKDGLSEYTIVYPADTIPSTHTAFAVSEMQTFVYEATGVSLPAVIDTGLTYEADAKYLSIGHTSVMEDAGIAVNVEEVNESGYIVKNKGASVFMAGGAFGNLHAVYDFLKYQFNFEVYAADEFTIDDCKKKDVKILQYDLKVIPDLSANIIGYGEHENNSEYARRLRTQTIRDVFLPDGRGGGIWHNFLGVISPITYDDPSLCTNTGKHNCINDLVVESGQTKPTIAESKAEYPDCVAGNYHPEWFSNGQLNLSSETQDEMIDVVVNCWKKWIEESVYNTGMAWTFTQMDTGTWSNAESSLALKEKYGVHSAEQIIFMNKCADEIRPWIEANYPDRKFNYLMFAYHETTQAPVKMVDGEYVPIDDEVVMDENVGLFLALSRADYYRPLTHEANKPWQTLMKQWRAVMPNSDLSLWLYGSYFDNYLVPLDIVNAAQANYQFAKENNGRIMYYQMQSDQGIASDWSRLNMYLMSKLGQDVNADVNKLTDDFFANYFKDASGPMRKMYDETRAMLAYIAETSNMSFGHSQGASLMSSRYWPYETLTQYLKYIDEAYVAIAKYKTSNPALYQKLHDRITLESIIPRFMLLKCYNVRITNQSMYAKELLTDAMNLGVTQAAEGTGRTMAVALESFM